MSGLTTADVEPAAFYETTDDFVAGAPTLPPPMPCVRDFVITAKGRHALYLYALDGDGGIRAGDDKRRAMLLTEAEAAYHLATLGDTWTMERVK